MYFVDVQQAREVGRCLPGKTGLREQPALRPTQLAGEIHVNGTIEFPPEKARIHGRFPPVARAEISSEIGDRRERGVDGFRLRANLSPRPLVRPSCGQHAFARPETQAVQNRGACHSIVLCGIAVALDLKLVDGLDEYSV